MEPQLALNSLFTQQSYFYPIILLRVDRRRNGFFLYKQNLLPKRSFNRVDFLIMLTV